MNTATEQRLANALRAAIPFLQAATLHDSGAKAVRDAAAAAVVEYDAAPNAWTFFIRDEDNTGTTYITCQRAATLEEAKAVAITECREDWGYSEDAPVHVLGIVQGIIGDVIEWDDME